MRCFCVCALLLCRCLHLLMYIYLPATTCHPTSALCSHFPLSHITPSPSPPHLACRNAKLAVVRDFVKREAATAAETTATTSQSQSQVRMLHDLRLFISLTRVTLSFILHQTFSSQIVFVFLCQTASTTSDIQLRPINMRDFMTAKDAVENATTSSA